MKSANRLRTSLIQLVVLFWFPTLYGTAVIIPAADTGLARTFMQDKPNRDGELPRLQPIQDMISVYIANAHEILRIAVQQYLGYVDADFGTYLSRLTQRFDPFLDEYGEVIPSYKKVFKFLWEQYNETLAHNYAIGQFDKDKLDLCSVARFLSHQPNVTDRDTLMKRMSNTLGYTCHPCTPYKRKEHGETIVPNTEDIKPDDFSPERSFIACKNFESNKGQDEKKDEACTRMGGTCMDWRTNVCIAGYRKGLCSGDFNNRCCLICDKECEIDEAIRSAKDFGCKLSGGHCMTNTNYCPLPYQKGDLCSGPLDRQCCPL